MKYSSITKKKPQKNTRRRGRKIKGYWFIICIYFFLVGNNFFLFFVLCVVRFGSFRFSIIIYYYVQMKHKIKYAHKHKLYWTGNRLSAKLKGHLRVGDKYWFASIFCLFGIEQYNYALQLISFLVDDKSHEKFQKCMSYVICVFMNTVKLWSRWLTVCISFEL